MRRGYFLPQWGIPLPSRLGGLGERRKLKKIWCILNVTEHFWSQDIVNHENSILQAEMQ